MFALIPFNSKAYIDPCKLPGTVTTFMVGTCQLLLMAHYTLYSCVDILHWAHTFGQLLHTNDSKDYWKGASMHAVNIGAGSGYLYLFLSRSHMLEFYLLRWQYWEVVPSWWPFVTWIKTPKRVHSNLLEAKGIRQEVWTRKQASPCTKFREVWGIHSVAAARVS